MIYAIGFEGASLSSGMKTVAARSGGRATRTQADGRSRIRTHRHCRRTAPSVSAGLQTGGARWPDASDRGPHPSRRTHRQSARQLPRTSPLTCARRCAHVVPGDTLFLGDASQSCRLIVFTLLDAVDEHHLIGGPMPDTANTATRTKAKDPGVRHGDSKQANAAGVDCRGHTYYFLFEGLQGQVRSQSSAYVSRDRQRRGRTRRSGCHDRFGIVAAGVRTWLRGRDRRSPRIHTSW
jgi:hypothetical protein